MFKLLPLLRIDTEPSDLRIIFRQVERFLEEFAGLELLVGVSGVGVLLLGQLDVGRIKEGVEAHVGSKAAYRHHRNEERNQFGIGLEVGGSS